VELFAPGHDEDTHVPVLINGAAAGATFLTQAEGAPIRLLSIRLSYADSEDLFEALYRRPSNCHGL